MAQGRVPSPTYKFQFSYDLEIPFLKKKIQESKKLKKCIRIQKKYNFVNNFLVSLLLCNFFQFFVISQSIVIKSNFWLEIYVRCILKNLLM